MNCSHSLGRNLAALGLTFVGMVSCADVDRRAPGAVSSDDTMGVVPPPSVAQTSCVDLDGDRFGMGCAPGPDCDDSNPAITSQCRECLRPSDGCPCPGTSAPVPCNLATGTTEVSPEGVCRLGQRVCRNNAWSSCEAFSSNGSALLIGAPSPCYGACDPSCAHTVDCLAPGDTLPAGTSNAMIANMPPAVFCPAMTANGGVQPLCENRPGGPYARTASTMTWIDACAAAGATVVLRNVDEGYSSVALPYSFSYWGVPYRNINVMANGIVQFASAPSQWVNTTLPAPSVPNSVFAFWDDLLMRNSGVCVAQIGTAPNRRTVIQWNDTGFYPILDPSTHLTFEVVLSEQTQSVDVLYNTMMGSGALSSGSSATIGVQEGGGARFDLVGYNTSGVVSSGMGFKWTPTSNDQYCERAVYNRVFEATCPAGAIPTIPTWGAINYTSFVPRGAAIRMYLRGAETTGGLATATPIRLPDAPTATSTTPVTTRYDLGDILTAAMPRLAHSRYLNLNVELDPGPDSNLAPVFGSVEVQFRCMPVEAPYRCEPRSDCFTAGACRRGVIACPYPLTPVCQDAGALPVGTPCGTRSVCDSTGACVSCDEGAPCDTGNVCTFGRISCATGAPVCETVSNRTAGTVCGFGSGAYTRDVSSLGWIDACALPGSDVYLATTTDSVSNITLPFGLRFYGTVRTTAGISSNGVMGFPTVPNTWDNVALPAVGMPDSIMAYWDDLQTRPAGVCVATLGRAPERLFIVEWADADLQDRGSSGNLGASLNFEVVLEESTQAINVLYGDMVGDARVAGSSATVGIQRGDLLAYNQYAFNTVDSVRPNSSMRWAPPIASICNGSGTCTMCTTTETCDGLDNNCNGLIDDGIADVTCGVGACRRTVAGCAHATPPTCTPGSPMPELCNGIDDDCDGMVDEACAGSITCPANAIMFAGDTRSFTVTPAGMLSNYNWSIVSAPSGGSTTARWTPTPPRSLTESFNPIIVGVYRIRVSAVDGLAMTRTCEFDVTANSRGLRVELTWNGTGDVDIHMHNNVSGAWFNRPNDCHYNNLTPAWGATQDVDNVTANGPENIRMNTPVVGTTYTVAVHNYANGAGRTATVKVYCGTTAGTVPTAVYVSTPLTGNSSGNCTGNTFWKVVDVRFNSDGTCTLTPRNVYTTSTLACTVR